jgi:hypothetical protein
LSAKIFVDVIAACIISVEIIALYIQVALKKLKRKPEET